MLSRQESFAGNITGADNRLIAEETALKGVNDVLTRIKELAIRCQWNFRSSGQRVSGYRNRRGLTEDLLSLANHKMLMITLYIFRK